MLARIAESLFWMGRYIERADGTARILDVHLQLLLEDPWIDEDSACRSLLSVMGSVPDEDRVLTRADILAMLAVDRDNPASIAFAIEAARANARQAREIVSTELWECLNATRAAVPRSIGAERVSSFFAWIRERSALAMGIIDSSTSRDEGWHFFTLGRSIERADVTARLLATRSAVESGPSWTTILRSCGAYEVYLRTYRGSPTAKGVAEFLLLDRLFPRSIMYSVMQAEQCIRGIDPMSGRLRIGVADDTERVLGEIRSELEFRPLEATLDDLIGNMDRVQQATSAASDGISRRYFPVHGMQSWIGEVI